MTKIPKRLQKLDITEFREFYLFQNKVKIGNYQKSCCGCNNSVIEFTTK